MDRDTFARRLHEAATAARDFARTFIEETLPDSMLFRVRLNSSYDGNPLHQDEVVFPGDSSFERGISLARCTEGEVVEVLWRDGRVPEWVDVSVVGETGASTVLQVMSCGRFTSNDALLYHEHEGRPPFHATGPVLPARFSLGECKERFSIYDRSECWMRGDLQHLLPHVHKVWSLELIGREFDDQVLLELPTLPGMEILELVQSPISGPGLVTVIRQPKLRVLRVGLDQSNSFEVPTLPPIGITTLDITSPPTASWGAAGLFRALPKLNWLTLTSPGDLYVDGVCPVSVTMVSITAKRVLGGFALPARIESLYLHLAETGEADLDQFLSRAKVIDNLDLSGTPVGIHFVERILQRHSLRYLNVVDTLVSKEEAHRIGRANPKLKLLPREVPET